MRIGVKSFVWIVLFFSASAQSSKINSGGLVAVDAERFQSFVICDVDNVERNIRAIDDLNRRIASDRFHVSVFDASKKAVSLFVVKRPFSVSAPTVFFSGREIFPNEQKICVTVTQQ